MKNNWTSIMLPGALILLFFVVPASLFSQTKPIVLSTDPPNGATGVSPDIKSISVTFSKPMIASGPCAATSSTWLIPQGNTCGWSADQRTMTLTRYGTSLPPLVAGSVVTIYLNYGSTSLKDTEGNALDTYTFSFTIFTLSSFTKIDANVQKGFSWPYYLLVPNTVKQPAILLVEPNNTGSVSDDQAIHDLAAKNEAQAWTSRMEELGCPYLIPTFPRPASHPGVYTQALNRDTLLTKLPGFERIDLQLIAMIDDARERLAAKSINVDRKVFMMGMSASGQFASRFVMLHPFRSLDLPVRRDGASLGVQPEPDGLVRPLGIVDLPATHRGAALIEVVDLAVRTEGEPSAPRQMQLVRLEPAPPACGIRCGLALTDLFSHGRPLPL